MDPGGPDMLAAEYALGVLEGADLGEARRRLLAEPDFAADAEWWQLRLAALAEDAGEAPVGEDVWRAIEARLDAQSGAGSSDTVVPLADPAPRRSGGPAGWSIATALAGIGALAAAVALYVATPQNAPPPLPEPSQSAPAANQLIAQAKGEDGTMRLAGVINPAGNTLSLKLVGFAPEPGSAPELWVVPEGGQPRSLGLIPKDGRFNRTLDAAEAGLLVEGATLAVTFEDDGSAPHSAPTTPILLAAPLDQV